MGITKYFKVQMGFTFKKYFPSCLVLKNYNSAYPNLNDGLSYNQKIWIIQSNEGMKFIISNHPCQLTVKKGVIENALKI